MAVSQTIQSSMPRVDGGAVAIIKSKWHANLVTNMSSACKQILLDHGVDTVCEYMLPGTLEMPLAVRALVDETKYDAFVCLSVVEKGKTAHFDMIIHATTQSLQRVSVEFKVPVINEIIAVYNLSDAIERTSDDQFNKGIEAAAAALEMIAFLRQRSD